MTENVYDDLEDTDFGENIVKLEKTNQALQKHIEKLEGDISKLCTELTEMKRVQQNLTRNISELFKTAKAEIARKDRMIADLRSELDRVLFKRQSKILAEPTTEALKRYSESPSETENQPKKQKFESSSSNFRGKHEDYFSRSRCNESPSESERQKSESSCNYSYVSKSKREDFRRDRERFRHKSRSRYHSSRSHRHDRDHNSRSEQSRKTNSHHQSKSTTRTDNNSPKRAPENFKSDVGASNFNADVEVLGETKAITNHNSDGVSPSNVEPKSTDESHVTNNSKFLVMEQKDVVDLTGPSKQLYSSETTVSKPDQIVDRQESVNMLSKEPALLNSDCVGDVTLSANNSPVGKKPVRRRRCVIQIID